MSPTMHLVLVHAFRCKSGLDDQLVERKTGQAHPEFTYNDSRELQHGEHAWSMNGNNVMRRRTEAG